jgi:hypothetical protein
MLRIGHRSSTARIPHVREDAQHCFGRLGRLFHRKQVASLDPRQPPADQPLRAAQPGAAQFLGLRDAGERDRAAQRMGARQPRQVVRQAVVDVGLGVAVEGEAPAARTARPVRRFRASAASRPGQCSRRFFDTIPGEERAPWPVALPLCSNFARQRSKLRRKVPAGKPFACEKTIVGAIARDVRCCARPGG